jgi:hypothetical protein
MWANSFLGIGIGIGIGKERKVFGLSFTVANYLTRHPT